MPQAPGRLQWDVTLTVPLGARTYQLTELVDPDSTINGRGWGIRLGEDSVLSFRAMETVTSRIQDSLRLDAFDYTITRPLTAILLPVDTAMNWGSSLRELNPDVAALHGTVQTLPPHALIAEREFSFGEGVDSFRVDTGSVFITVRNTFAYNIDNLSVGIRVHGGGERPIAEYATLEPNEMRSLHVALNTFQLDGASLITVNGYGRGGEQILVDSTRGIVFSAEVTTLQCVPYYGMIGVQHLERDSSFALDQRHRLFEGIIDHATINILLVNQTQLDDSVWMLFPDLRDENGDTLRAGTNVPAHSSAPVSMALNGYQLTLRDGIPQHIRALLYSRSYPTNDHRYFSGEGGEKVEGHLSVSDIYFRTFDGILSDLTVDIRETRQSVDRPPNGWERVHPTVVDGSMRILSAAAICGDVMIDISSWYDGSLIDRVRSNFYEVCFGSDTLLSIPDMASLIDTYPDQFIYSGSIIARGAAIIDDTQDMTAQVIIDAPLRFTIDGVDAPGEIERAEPEAVERVRSAEALVKVWNRLPLGGSAYLIASRDSASLEQFSGADVDTVAIVSIPQPVVSQGRAVGESYAEYRIALPPSIIDMLETPPFFARVQITLPGHESEEFLAHAADYVRVQVTAQVVREINTEENP